MYEKNDIWICFHWKFCFSNQWLKSKIYISAIFHLKHFVLDRNSTIAIWEFFAEVLFSVLWIDCTEVVFEVFFMMVFDKHISEAYVENIFTLKENFKDLYCNELMVITLLVNDTYRNQEFSTKIIRKIVCFSQFAL